MVAKGLSEMMVEGVKVDIFDGCGVFVLAIQFASTLGLPYMKPVCGAVAGAAEALRFDESLEKHGGVLVAGVLIVRESFGGKSKYLGGEVS